MNTAKKGGGGGVIQSDGWFISPRGETIEVPLSHITMVTQHPEKFGFSKEEIQAYYDKFGERIGFEGKAREELLTDLVKRHWIRVRWHPRIDRLTFQLDRLTNQAKDHMRDLAVHIIERAPGMAGANAMVVGIRGEHFGNYELEAIANDVLYGGMHEHRTSPPLKFVSIKDYEPVEWDAALAWASARKHQVVEGLPPMKNLYTIFDVAAASTPDELTEASLGRLYSLWKQSGEKSWAMFSGWRHENSRAKNNAQNQKLEEQLRKWDLGYVHTKGHSQEHDDETGDSVDVMERSFWVNGITKKQAEKVLHDFKQTSILYSGPDTRGDVLSIKRDGTEEDLGKFHPMKIGDYYSEVKGKPWTFEVGPYPMSSAIILDFYQRAVPGIREAGKRQRA